MKRRLVAWVAAAAMIAVGAAAAAAPQQPQPLHLAIGYIPHVQFTPLYVGIEKGFYQREAIDLEISYGFEVDVFALLVAGKIDLGLSDSDQLILAGAKDLGLVAVYQYYQQYPVTIVARADRVRSPEDLAGRLIGTPEMFGTSWIGLQLFLNRYGLAGKARVERIGYTQVESLLANRVDAAVCFFNNEPLLLKSEGIDIRQWQVRDFSDMVGASFISSRAILKDRADLLARFVRATRDATAYTIDHREESLAIALKTVGNVQQEDVPLMRQRLDATCELFASPGGYGSLDPARWQGSIDELARLGLISASYPASRILSAVR